MNEEYNNNGLNGAEAGNAEANAERLNAPASQPSAEEKTVAEEKPAAEPTVQAQPAGELKYESYAEKNGQTWAPQGGQTVYSRPMYSQPQQQPYAQPQQPYAQPQQPDGQYAPYGQPAYRAPYTAPNPEPKKKEKKEKRKGGSAFGYALLFSLIFSLLFSAVSGGIVYSVLRSDVALQSGQDSVSPSAGGNSVIFEAVDSESNPNASSVGNTTAVSSVVDKVASCVVEITTEAVVNDYYYGRYVASGAGSGVVITSDGYIVTNNHVIDGAETITVMLKDGTKYEAKLIGTDAQTDIAVIKVEATGLNAAVTGDSSKLVVGEMAVAIGNPLGQLGGTVTDGIISALDREITIDDETMTLIQTNAAVNPGNSGGGLFNINGELIGIVNAKNSGSEIEGLGFAIPINTVKDTVSQLIEHGYVRGRAVLGINARDILTASDAWTYRVSEYGVYVTGVHNGDFKVGDRLVAIDTNTVSSMADVKKMLKKYAIGDEVTVTVSRDGRMVDLKVTLIESTPVTEEETQPAQTQPSNGGGSIFPGGDIWRDFFGW